MLIPRPPSIDSDSKSAADSGDAEGYIPGFPTEGGSYSGDDPIVVRRVSSEDRARINAYSVENDNAGWIKTKLFKKEARWPRELYVHVLGCKGLLPTASGSSVDNDSAYEVVGSGSDGSQANGQTSDGDNEGNVEHDSEGRSDVGDGVGSDEEQAGFECFVKVMNTTTGNDLHSLTAKGSLSPVLEEHFIVPCQGPRDALVVGAYAGNDEKGKLIGEATLPLDARFVGGGRRVLLTLVDADRRRRGFVRAEAFWVDEAKPHKETGDFYYKVVHPSGIALRDQPSTISAKSLHVMAHGEVFKACERQRHAGLSEEEGTVFVRLSASADRWTRTGWLFEALVDQSGHREAVLERVGPPKRERGNFFYRVCDPRGLQLHSRADIHSKLHSTVTEKGSVLEADEKWTPAGSPVTFVTVAGNRGYLIERCDGKIVKNESGEPTLEVMTCPEGVLVSSQGTGEGVPPPTPPPSRPSTPNMDGISGSPVTSTDEYGHIPVVTEPANGTSTLSSTNVTAEVVPEKVKAAITVQQRLYRVRVGEGGVVATKTPDIVSTPVDKMKEGQPFYGRAEVVKHYEGIGEVAFVMRSTDGLWVRANRPGMMLLLDLITDQTEAGAFTYRVCHENGVVVRTAPGLNAPPIKPRRILPVTKLISVCERLVRAEDIIELNRPPVFLRLAGNDGWVFDRRGHTLVCEDVTEKSRIATVNAITAEATRLARSGQNGNGVSSSSSTR